MKKLLFAMLACLPACQKSAHVEPVEQTAVAPEVKAEMPQKAVALVDRLQAIKLSKAPSQEETQRGLEMKASFLAGERVNHEPEDAKAWLSLAAADERPSVVATALIGMMRTYRTTPQPDQGLTLIDADYKTVVLERMKDSHPEVISAAILAAYNMLSLPDGPDAQVVDALIGWTQKTGDEEAKLLSQKVISAQGLFNLSAFRSKDGKPAELKEKVIKAHVEMLASKQDSALVMALHNLNRTAYVGMPLTAQLLEALKPLEAHQNPVVAALAMCVHFRVTEEAARADVAKQLEKQLNSTTSAFAKASLVIALAEGKRAETLPSIGKLLDSTDNPIYEMKDAIDGEFHEPISLKYGTSRLDEMGLWALKEISDGMQTPFTYPHIGPGKKGEDTRTEALKAAREWLANQKP